MRTRVWVAAVVVAGSVAFGGAAADEAMDSSALRRAVSGKTVHLATPMGGLPIRYLTDGTMSGSAGTLAAYTGSLNDRGRWWVAADKLCQRWNSWLSGKLHCFTLRQQGGSVHWTRDDGLSGVATIAR